MSAFSPQDQVIPAVSGEVEPKFWSGLAERLVAIIFAAASVVAMVGWLYLLAQGLWAAASWLLF
jgi:hypothetical protein